MLQTIYIDVLFIINFSMDFLAVFITSYLLKIKIKTYKNTLAALFLALYSVLTVMLRFEGMIVALLFAYFLCLFAFGKRSFKESLQIYIAFIAVNFLLGGGMTALFSLFNSIVGERLVMIYGDVSEVPGKLPFNIFAIGVTFITAIIMMFGKIFTRKGTARSVNAEIFLAKKSSAFTLTEDSGNMLTEALSGEPVIFLNEKALLRITDEKTLFGIKNLDPDLMKKSGLKMRLTAYETVGGREMCVLVRPEKVMIGGRSVRAWIACCKTDTLGDSDGIVPSVLISN